MIAEPITEAHEDTEEELLAFEKTIDSLEMVKRFYPTIQRECGYLFLKLINDILGELDRSPSWWKVAFAVGSMHCEGKSMTEVAKELGVGRADISKGATDFCRRAGIPTSFYMKPENAQSSYRESRQSQLS